MITYDDGAYAAQFGILNGHPRWILIDIDDAPWRHVQMIHRGTGLPVVTMSSRPELHARWCSCKREVIHVL